MMDAGIEDNSNHDFSGYDVRVTDAAQNGDTFVYVIKSQQISSDMEYRVEREFEDFEWLQHCLLTQEGVTGLHGIIFPPLPAKPGTFLSNSEAKTKKKIESLAMVDNWQMYCRALEEYLHLVTAHPVLVKNPAVHSFLKHREPPIKTKVKKGIFNKLTQAVEELRKEHHKDIDDFFQNERDSNLTLTAFTKAAAEKFLEIVLTEQKIAIACGHFSTALHLGIGQDDDPADYAFAKMCLKLSEVLDTVKKNFEKVAENDLNTLGFNLELHSRFQDAEKEMLFRRTCKLVDVETANKNLGQAKPHKKAAMEDIKKAADKEFDEISGMAKVEIQRYHRERVRAFQKALIELSDSQLQSARECCVELKQQLAEFKQLCAE
ncbi:sorting nexin-6-like isoform X1 [Acipenser ruthenus]|uniref:sorting nexin-6-like isoform X1 n=1 Tax=Acipenser ruthenus TaxID=7906 RepID=UPI002740576D|nr:sorting nexin-6-like isoform X1 [Acipenser ruthenus]